MLLCDIGNSSYHFLDETKNYKEDVDTFNPKLVTKKVYFISVNEKISEMLRTLDNWIDLSEFVDKSSYYNSMGIDRIVACEAIENSIVLDAGSALTVDVVRDGKFFGGFIYPGVNAMSKTYKNISLVLDYSFNFELDLDIMPKNSQDAISYGYLKTLYLELMSHNLPIVLTGGDALMFKKIFKDATVDEELIFCGMKKIIKEANIC